MGRSPLAGKGEGKTFRAVRRAGAKAMGPEVVGLAKAVSETPQSQWRARRHFTNNGWAGFQMGLNSHGVAQIILWVPLARNTPWQWGSEKQPQLTVAHLGPPSSLVFFLQSL